MKNHFYTITTGNRKFSVESERSEDALIFAAFYLYKDIKKMLLFPSKSKPKKDCCIAVIPKKLPIKAERCR